MAAERPKPRFSVQISGIDRAEIHNLDHYELHELIDTIRGWFPEAKFEVTVADHPKNEPTAPAAAN